MTAPQELRGAAEIYEVKEGLRTLDSGMRKAAVMKVICRHDGREGRVDALSQHRQLHAGGRLLGPAGFARAFAMQGLVELW